jgi:cephalosporin hydroxylase
MPTTHTTDVIRIDLARGLVIVEADGRTVEHATDSPEAFAIVSRAWLRCGWDTKYVYGFSWLGRPIIQLPEDLIRIQEVIYRVRPDVIIETGVAHGGGLIFYATLCKAMERGRVVGVDIEIRPHNRAAIESHFLFPGITLIEGDSVAPPTLDLVRAQIRPGDTVLVCLDSCHTRAHVLAELEAYAPLVTPGSYIVAMDGIMKDLAGAPRTEPDWTWNNPTEAAREFAARHPEFTIEEPELPFNEGSITQRVTYWPEAYLRRRP